MNYKNNKLLFEATINDLFIRRVAEKANLDLRKFPMHKIIDGFKNEMDFHIRMKFTPVDTLHIVFDNLAKDLDWYETKVNLKDRKKITKESEGLYDVKKISHKLIIKNGVDNIDDQKKEILKKFIIFVSQNLNLDDSCKIYLSSKRNNHLETTASYNRENHNIWIYVKNRNMLGDILRSLAHEMMHFKQNLRGDLHLNSGKDGSPHENEANTFSGIMIRKFGRMFPEIYI